MGGIIAAWTTFGTQNYQSSWSWRLPSLLQLLLPIVALPGFWLTPESPRWLVSVGRHNEARTVLARYQTSGDENADVVNTEMIEISRAIELERGAQAETSYLDMISTKGNRRRTMISITLGAYGQIVGNSVISYYMPLVLYTVGIEDPTKQTLISGCLQIWNLLWSVAASLFVEKIGRRTLFLLSASIMFVSNIVVTALSGSFSETGNLSVGLAAVPMIFVYYAGYEIALVPLTISYPCEIWSYALRARGLTVSQILGSLFGILQTFVNPIGLEQIG